MMKRISQRALGLVTPQKAKNKQENATTDEQSFNPTSLYDNAGMVTPDKDQGKKSEYTPMEIDEAAGMIVTRFVPTMNTDGPVIRTDLKTDGTWWDNRTAFYLENVFSPQECKDLIARSEEQGYERALVNIGYGKQMEILDTRLSLRCIIDDVKIADVIWERIKDQVPQVLPSGMDPKQNVRAVGLNERMRILKYDGQGYFRMHRDGTYVRPKEHPRAGDHSLITVLWYLNSHDEYVGCRTHFFDETEGHALELEPSVGGVLVFTHNILHNASEMKSGVKYILRTDIMYTSRDD